MSDDHFQIRTIAGMGFSDPEGPNTAENALVQMVSADVTFEPEPVDPFTLEGYLSGTVFFSQFLFFCTVRQQLQCRAHGR